MQPNEPSQFSHKEMKHKIQMYVKSQGALKQKEAKKKHYLQLAATILDSEYQNCPITVEV